MDKKFFFDRYGLAQADIERYLSAALSAGGDFADLYFEYQTSTSVSLDESMVKSATQGISVGCGVRVLSGERTGYAYTDDLSPERLLHAASTAALIASGPAKQPVVGLTDKPAHNLYPVPLPSVEAEVLAKVDLVQRADKAARAYDPRIHEVRVSYADELRRILVIGSDGSFAEDAQPLARMSVFCIAKDRGRGSARGTAGGGGRVALDYFQGEASPEHFAKEAARQAIIQLDAREAPAGEMEVVLGPGWPGILLHEAIGHGLEADFNRKKTSAFSGMLGRRVASDKCTVVDNGTMPGRRGSLNVDDEGNQTENTVLIENGILKGYLSDKLSSRLMGIRNTGNGRRESYQHIPMPRMTNTYMLAGQDSPEDIIQLGEVRRVCGELRRRAGGHHQRQVRLLRLGSLPDRERHDHFAAEERDAHRQRPGCADQSLDGGQRSATRRRRRHLRQGWTVGAGRRGHSHAEGGPADRRRNRRVRRARVELAFRPAFMCFILLSSRGASAREGSAVRS